MRVFVLLSIVAGLITSSAIAADEPGQQISLNNRVFMNVSSVYDPNYGLLRIAVIRNGVIDYLPTPDGFRRGLPVEIKSRNFEVYSKNSEEGKGGKVSIPVLGSVETSTTQVAFASMEDISEVYAPNRDLTSCQIWKFVKKDQVEPGDTIIYTQQATLTKVTFGTADGQDSKAAISAGSYFSIGANQYKQASEATKKPLIAVTGSQFKVKDPKSFCNERLKSNEFVSERPVPFNSLSDLGLKALTYQPN